MPTIGMHAARGLGDAAQGDEAADGGAAAEEAPPQSFPSLRDSAAAGGAAAAPARAHAAQEPAAGLVDPSLDDTYWAAYAPGAEPAPGAGVVCLVVKMPCGSRCAPIAAHPPAGLPAALVCVCWSVPLPASPPRALTRPLAHPVGPSPCPPRTARSRGTSRSPPRSARCSARCTRPGGASRPPKRGRSCSRRLRASRSPT